MVHVDYRLLQIVHVFLLVRVLREPRHCLEAFVADAEERLHKTFNAVLQPQGEIPEAANYLALHILVDIGVHVVNHLLEEGSQSIRDATIVAPGEVREAVECRLESILLIEHIEPRDSVLHIAIEEVHLDVLLEGEGHRADHVDPLRLAAVNLDVVVGELEHLDLRVVLELHVGGEREHAGVDDGDELVEDDALVPHLGLGVLVVELHQVLEEHLDHRLLHGPKDDVHDEQDDLLVRLLVQVLLEVAGEDRHQRFQDLVGVR